MPDIFHDFPIFAPRDQVFEAVSSASGLDAWWTQRASGEAAPGATWGFGFGAGYDWRGIVQACQPGLEIEWELTESDSDWRGTRLGFHLEDKDGHTQVRFHHTGWPESNEHYRVSCFCWAMYLRLLKRYIEHGEVVPYAQRLEA